MAMRRTFWIDHRINDDAAMVLFLPWLERVDIHRVQISALTIDSMDMNALGVCS
jgi:hypothetical protein